jgi:hypothetical protein
MVIVKENRIDLPSPDPGPARLNTARSEAK